MNWAKSVLEFDGNKCCYCGSTENLNAHHIKSKSEFPELANKIENGVTLCRKCHRLAHNGSYNKKGSCLTHLEGNPKEVENFIIEYAKEKKKKIQDYAESRKETTNGFINRVVDEAMKHNK